MASERAVLLLAKSRVLQSRLSAFRWKLEHYRWESVCDVPNKILELDKELIRLEGEIEDALVGADSPLTT